MTTTMTDDLRPLLFSLVYRMVGSAGDAEDLVQEAFLRLHREQREGTEIESQKAFLTTIVTRLAIDHLRSARVRREEYVGEWLSEPLLVDPGPTPADEAERSDTLSLAFLVVLESLSPLERAVFLLHDVFGYSHAEIAEIVGRREENCRQIALRARRAIDDRRPRFDPSDEERRRVAERFFAALAGDVSDIAAVLAEDVVMHGDGGGKVPSIARPLVGADRVGRAWANWAKLGLRLAARIEMTLVNGQPGALLKTAEGALLTVVSLDIVEGRVKEIRNILNPDKLDHLAPVADFNELLAQVRLRA